MNGIFYAFAMYFDAKFGRQYKPHLSALIYIKKVLPFAPMSIFSSCAVDAVGQKTARRPSSAVSYICSFTAM